MLYDVTYYPFSGTLHTRVPDAVPTRCLLPQPEACLSVNFYLPKVNIINHGNMQYDESDEQYSVLPWAIANKVGNLHKSSKSNWSDKLATRHGSSDPPVFISNLPLLLKLLSMMPR